MLLYSNMAESVETVTTIDQETTEPINIEEQAPEENATSNIEELKKAISDEGTKANNDAEEEEEEYVLKDEAHEEEETQKESETNGKEDDGKAHEKEEEDSNKTPQADGSLGATVAKHYNSIPESGREARKQSRIFHLRSFNNWVKSVLINEFLEKVKKTRRRYDEEINVLDLGCGKGGDLLKWQKGRVGHVICADIAETSVEQCHDRYENMKKSQRQGGYRESRERLFSIECIPADCTKVNILEKFKTKDIQLDLTSCQFAFHYSFESYKQADVMLQNACENLRPGGYFIGTTPDCHELVKRLKKSDTNSFGNDVYKIDFESKEDFSLFGAKYNFKLADVVDCPEFLVYFPIVEKLAEKYNMKLVYKKNFRDIFKERNKDYGNLLHKMQALEAYPARKGWSLVSDKEEDYSHVKLQSEGSQIGREKVVGTLTKDEWEAAGLYMAFAFEKIDPEETKREAKEKAQKRAASPDKEEESGPPAKRTRDADRTKERGEIEDASEEVQASDAAKEFIDKDVIDTEMSDTADGNEHEKNVHEESNTSAKEEASTGNDGGSTDAQKEATSENVGTGDQDQDMRDEQEITASEQGVEETTEENKSAEETEQATE